MDEDVVKGNANLVIALILAVALYFLLEKYFALPLAYMWKYFKLVQFYVLFAFESTVMYSVNYVSHLVMGRDLVTGWEFTHGLEILVHTSPKSISPQFRETFDYYYGVSLRWPFALLVIYIGWKERGIRSRVSQEYDLEKLIRKASTVYPHLRRLVPPRLRDKVLAALFGWYKPEYKERLKGVNPMAHSHDFDFDNRDDKNNRFAMGVSASEMLLANPPLGVTQEEIDQDKTMQESTGFASQFRPICHFFYEDDSTESSMDFCPRTATLAMERLMTRPLPNQITALTDVARLFDEEGNIIPLVYIDEKGEQIYKWKTGAKIADGFRANRLLNDGKPYKGSVENTQYLFNHCERKILKQLKDKIEDSSERSFDEILYAMVTTRHAYSTTVIWGLVDLFKNRSRIAGTEFTWVMEFDRTLGMIMQSIGRETPFWEAAGTRSHYLIEGRCKFPVTTPIVSKAVEDLYENADRLLKAGAKKENIFKLSSEEYAQKYMFGGADSHIRAKEEKANKILSDLGFDNEKIEYQDPYADIPELMKLYGED